MELEIEMINVVGGFIFAVCQDGHIYKRHIDGGEWSRIGGPLAPEELIDVDQENYGSEG